MRQSVSPGLTRWRTPPAFSFRFTSGFTAWGLGLWVAAAVGRGAIAISPGSALLADLRGEIGRKARRVRVVAALDQADGKGRDSPETALHGGRDGARIVHIIREVRAAVDAARHQIGAAGLEDVVEADIDGVGRGAVHRPALDVAPGRQLLDAQRPVQRDAAAGG